MKIISFTVQIRAEFYDHDQIGSKEAAALLCQDINQILTKYDGSTGSAQIVHGPKNLKVSTRPTPSGSNTSRSRRRCKGCGQPERIRSIGGIRFSNITEHLGLCAKCINTAMKA